MRKLLLCCTLLALTGCQPGTGGDPMAECDFEGRDFHQWVTQLQDEDDYLRREATAAMERIGPENKDTVPALTRMVKHPNAEVRWLAVRALGRIGNDAKKAHKEVANAMNDKDRRVRTAAIKAIYLIDRRTPKK
jgi:HEAT repeat protein